MRNDEGSFPPDEKGLTIMADKKNMTQAEAIATAIKACEDNGVDLGDAMPVLKHIHETMTKPREQKSGPSKTTLANIETGKRVRDALVGQAPMTVAQTWQYLIQNGAITVEEIGSTQKMNAILERNVPGAQKEKTSKGVMYSVNPDSDEVLYTPATDENAADEDAE